MRGSSRGASKAVQTAFDEVLATGTGVTLAEELFAVTTVVDGNASLRRALADPSREASDKQGLARALFGGKVGETTTGLVAEVAGQRWAAERDLGDTLENLAVQTLLASAEREGRIDRVEDELFRFERIVAGDPALRDTLSSRNRDGTARPRSFTGSSRPRPRPRPCGSPSRRAPPARPPLGPGPGRVPHLAAMRREELTALVTVAAPLMSSSRPACAVRSRRTTPGRALQVVLDPRVMGGIRVQVGDEVVDGTVLRRLEEARRHVTGS